MMSNGLLWQRQSLQLSLSVKIPRKCNTILFNCFDCGLSFQISIQFNAKVFTKQLLLRSSPSEANERRCWFKLSSDRSKVFKCCRRLNPFESSFIRSFLLLLETISPSSDQRSYTIPVLSLQFDLRDSDKYPCFHTLRSWSDGNVRNTIYKWA